MKPQKAIRPVYLDFAATTPVDPEVADLVMYYMREEFGNAGSRTHQYGSAAKQAVGVARRQIAAVVDASPNEVVFTSGATESNNLAILGLAKYGMESGKKHIVTTVIEHKSVLEPIRQLGLQGFEISEVSVGAGGRVSEIDITSAVREDTLLVSMMHANNETGIMQPVQEVCNALKDRRVILHIDAAQTFGKYLDELRNERIDLISCSGHKLSAPKGTGALVVRTIRDTRKRLSPIMRGGGQENGLRPGTLAVPLIAGLGLAAELAMGSVENWGKQCRRFGLEIVEGLEGTSFQFIGDRAHAVDHILCIAFTGIDAESLFVGFKDIVAISNGSACSSNLRAPSHVLKAMNLPESVKDAAIRLSWGKQNGSIALPKLSTVIKQLQI